MEPRRRGRGDRACRSSRGAAGRGVAAALAALGRDAEAVEATGLAEAQGVQVSSMSDFAGASFTHLLGDALIVAARDRLGPAADEPLARGRAVPAARRVAHACALARVPSRSERHARRPRRVSTMNPL